MSQLIITATATNMSAILDRTKGVAQKSSGVDMSEEIARYSL